MLKTFAGLTGLVMLVTAIPKPELQKTHDYSQPDSAYTYNIVLDTRNPPLAMTESELERLSSYEDNYEGPHLYMIQKEKNMVHLPNFQIKINRNNKGIARLVKKLSLGIQDKDIQAQLLLDYVTNNIEYIEMKGYESLTHTLLTKEGRCAEKSVLYATLLEHTNTDYLLISLIGHEVVAIHSSIPDNNNTSFYFHGERYIFAETTCPNYQIGETILEEPYDKEKIIIIQKKGSTTVFKELE